MIDLIFDGYCEFCIRSLELLKRFDANDRLVLVDGNNVEYVAAHYPGLNQADLSTAMYAVHDGRYYRGYDAFRLALENLGGGMSALGAIMKFPPIRAIGLVIYDKVAKNRRSFGCSSGACKI